MTGRPDVARRHTGSAAAVAREGRTDAVSAGIAHGSDEGALSATRRGGARAGASAAAARAVRLEDRRRRAAEAADWNSLKMLANSLMGPENLREYWTKAETSPRLMKSRG